MSDPTLPEGATELAKLGGAAGGGSLLAFVLGRMFGGQDKVLARLDALQLAVASVGQQLAVASDRASRFEGDVEHLKSEQQKQGDRLTRLEAQMEQVREGLAT
jgi:hypothetical protein